MYYVMIYYSCRCASGSAATRERAMAQNFNVIGTGKEPMPQNMIGNLRPLRRRPARARRPTARARRLKFYDCRICVLCYFVGRYNRYDY